MFAVLYLKFKQRPNLKIFCQNGADGKANSEDPDQTAPIYVPELRIIMVIFNTTNIQSA